MSFTLPAQADLPESERELRIYHSLLDACLSAVDEFGLKGLKMNHIIERSDVSRRTAYRYFDNKHSVVAACYRRESHRILETVYGVVASSATVEDIFVNAFLFVHGELPKNPILRTILYESSSLHESLQGSGETLMQALLNTLDLGKLFDTTPDLQQNIFALSEYWVQVLASFLLLDIGKGKTQEEIEHYVRKRFLPGLCLQDYGLA